MPYYLHSRTIELTEDNVNEHGVGSFATQVDARQYMIDNDRTSDKVTFIPTHDESHTWRVREDDRMRSGVYTPTPWSSRDQYSEHRAHPTESTAR